MGNRAALSPPTSQPPLPGSNHRAPDRAAGADPVAMQRLPRRRRHQQLGRLALRPAPAAAHPRRPRQPDRHQPRGRRSTARAAVARCRLRTAGVPDPRPPRRRRPAGHRRGPGGADRVRGRRSQPRVQPAPPAATRHRIQRTQQRGSGLGRPVTRMPLPELDVARVQRWCAARVPEHARHQVRVECELAPRHLTIVERRVPWREDYGPEWTSFPIARLRYTATDRSWTLYWRDRHLRFHIYDPLAPSHRVEDLLTEIDRDPTCIFWG